MGLLKISCVVPGGSVPLVPSSIIEPLWVEFAALIGADDQPEVDPAHPMGCHRHRIADRVVFDCVVAALVHGSGYERVAVRASACCSDRIIRRRLHEWAGLGGTRKVLKASLEAYDRVLGLELEDLAVDAAITRSPCGGPVSGRSPVDRGKQGTKRSVVTDAFGIQLHLVAAAANAHDSPLLAPSLAGLPDTIGPLPDGARVHLDIGHDAGYDSGKTRTLLEDLGYRHAIASKGTPAPIQAGRRWPVERTHSWMNGYGKLRRSTDKTAAVVEFYLFLAAALTVIRRLITRSCTRYRWDTRPTTRRLR